MEIPVVNLNDEIIGHKDRSELDYDNDIFRTASLWITNSDGDVLLAQRKYDKKVDPGKWAEAVGGTVEGNDSYIDTVIREVKEELGLDYIEMKLGPKQFIDMPCQYFVQWCFACINKSISSFVIQEEEIEQIVWMPIDQLCDELKTNPNKYIEAIPEIVKLLTK